MQINSFFNVQKKRRISIILLLLFTTVLSLLSIFIGQYNMSISDTVECVFGIKTGVDAENIRSIVLNIRLPRTMASIIIGGTLAISGLTYQCVFRNILVSQDILGISTSACVGAAFGIIMGLSALYIQVLAFGMGILGLLIVFALSSRIKLDRTLSLILSGILIGGAMSSFLALIKYLANPETQLQSIVFWTMGDISSITMEQLAYVAVPMTVCTAILFMKRWDLNYFCYADSEAKSLGVNINRNRNIFLTCATVLVASGVSISGAIGWIGLVIPHLVRLLIGTNNSFTMPLSFLLGSSFLLVVDLLNRIVTTAELPVSIITGLLGLPLFIICWFINTKHTQERII